MSGAQILLLAVVLFFVINLVRKFMTRKIFLRSLVIWLTLWALAAAVIIFPQATQIVAEKLGLGRGVDMIIYLSLLALFYLTFHLLLRQQESEEQLTKLARKIALMDAEKNTNKPE